MINLLARPLLQTAAFLFPGPSLCSPIGQINGWPNPQFTVFHCCIQLHSVYWEIRLVVILTVVSAHKAEIESILTANIHTLINESMSL